MRANEFITEAWSEKYKRSINCSNPKGFSQKAHCQGRKKTDEEVEQLDEKCWDTHKQVGIKKKSGKMVPNCVPKESVSEEKLEFLQGDLVKPNLVFIFEGRSFGTPERGDDCYESDNPFQNLVREIYKKWHNVR
jgi:hypothetical protein